MLVKLNFLKIKKYNLVIFGLILWLYVCSNIGAYPLTFDRLKTLLYFGDYNFIEKGIFVFNFFRSHTVYLIPFLIFLVYFYKNKITSSTFINLYFLFFLTQVFGTLLLLNTEKFGYERNFLLYNSFSTLLILYFLSIYELKNYLKFILLLTITLLALVIVFHLFKLVNEYILSPEMFFFYNSQLWDKLVFGNSYIRVTGLSRSIMLILLLTFIINLYVEKINIKKILLNIIIFLCIFFIWILQSRTQIYYLPLAFLLVAALVYEDKKFKIIFRNLFLVIIYFSISYFLVPKLYEIKKNIYTNASVNSDFYKKYLKTKELTEFETNETENFFSTFKEITSETFKSEGQKTPRVNITKNISSSRIFIWNNMLVKYDKTKIFGYGNQGDRFELGLVPSEQKYSGYYNNASNAYIYSFICGGYIGLIIFVLINLYILRRIFLILLNKSKIKLDWALIASSNIILFLMFRSIVENGHANFSLDFVVFILCSLIVLNDTNKLDNIKFNLFYSTK